VEVLEHLHASSLLHITITEGKNRQVLPVREHHVWLWVWMWCGCKPDRPHLTLSYLDGCTAPHFVRPWWLQSEQHQKAFGVLTMCVRAHVHVCACACVCVCACV
jgi:hypothetical protein